MYLGMDGTGVPMRNSELVGRAGKQPDGSSKTREVKLVTVWSAEGRDKEGTPVRDEGSISYSAAIESAASRDTDKAPSEFARRVDREARRRGFDQAQRRVVLGDGAVVDLGISPTSSFQAQSRSWTSSTPKGTSGTSPRTSTAPAATSASSGPKSGAMSWTKARSTPCSRPSACMRSSTTRPASAWATSRDSQNRMRYPEFRAQGLCTSTGVVEAGCKVAIGTRLKRSGMHWSVTGADAIIALRCCKLSGRFEDFWQRGSEPPRATAA
jgi:hypothetical protein